MSKITELINLLLQLGPDFTSIKANAIVEAMAKELEEKYPERAAAARANSVILERKAAYRE